MADDFSFPGLMQRTLADGITWRFYKHWGQSYLAGEDKEELRGDHSGGVRVIRGLRMTNAPCVAQARLYESDKGSISAVYSYPNGIGVCDEYFWEIYDSELMDGPERYATEEEMERRVRDLLAV